MEALTPLALKDVRKKWIFESSSPEFYKHQNLPSRLWKAENIIENDSPFVAEYAVSMTIQDVYHNVPGAFPGNLDYHPMV